MVKIEAVIKPHKLDAVKEALAKAGVTGMTVLEVRGFGKQKGHEDVGGDAITIEFLPKLKLEIVCNDEQRETIVNTIAHTAKTGKIGDGKIFISPVSDALRIRTNERGKSAVE